MSNNDYFYVLWFLTSISIVKHLFLSLSLSPSHTHTFPLPFAAVIYSAHTNHCIWAPERRVSHREWPVSIFSQKWRSDKMNFRYSPAYIHVHIHIHIYIFSLSLPLSLPYYKPSRLFPLYLIFPHFNSSSIHTYSIYSYLRCLHQTPFPHVGGSQWCICTSLQLPGMSFYSACDVYDTLAILIPKLSW